MSDIRPARPIDGVNRVGGNEPAPPPGAQQVVAEKQPEIKVESQQMPPQPQVQQAIMSSPQPVAAAVQAPAPVPASATPKKRTGRKVLAAILILLAIALVAGALYYKLVLS